MVILDFGMLTAGFVGLGFTDYGQKNHAMIVR
jgi:hypothetical protein